MSHSAILTLNAGSSSLRFALFESAVDGAVEARVRGDVSGIGHDAQLSISVWGDATSTEPLKVVRTHEDALRAALERVKALAPATTLLAAGHRVVHGGEHLIEPTFIDGAVRAEIERLIPLAPLHQPNSLAGIDAFAATHPATPQVACFDTAFHHSQPELATLFALPPQATAGGVRRYGFHGLSYESIAQRLPADVGPRSEGRVIVAHLGSGASLCAMRERRSVATTMGFSALDGIPMGTRPGALDPGVLLYLLEQGWTRERLSSLLWEQSGLLGVSGISDDVRDLLASSDPRAALALNLFAYRVSREIGSLAAALEGVDLLVFSAGIGEHAAPIRTNVCARSAWLGIELDAQRNARGSGRISADGSAVEVYVIPTDEEATIARHTFALLRPNASR